MKKMMDIDVFGMLGGYIDYFAVSGSGGADAGPKLGNNFSVGGGWIADQDNVGYENMQILRGFNSDFAGNPLWTGAVDFSNTNVRNTTWSSRALAYNTETGFSMQGTFGAGTLIGMTTWNNLTFTFGSFERVPAPAEVPEPGTLLMLGLAAAGIPVVRRWRRG